MMILSYYGTTQHPAAIKSSRSWKLGARLKMRQTTKGGAEDNERVPISGGRKECQGRESGRKQAKETRYNLDGGDLTQCTKQ